MLQQFIGLLIVNLLFSLMPGIAWQAHLGGFLTGMAVAGLLYATRGRERARYQWPALAGVLVVLVVLAGVKYGVADTGFVDSVYRYV